MTTMFVPILNKYILHVVIWWYYRNNRVLFMVKHNQSKKIQIFTDIHVIYCLRTMWCQKDGERGWFRNIYDYSQFFIFFRSTHVLFVFNLKCYICEQCKHVKRVVDFQWSCRYYGLYGLKKNNKMKRKTITKRDVHLKSIESKRVIIIIVVIGIPYNIMICCSKKIMVIKNQKWNLI